MALPIEDYALIGDRGTAALVGKDGSIDWLCLPRFDSPACFAALLGTEDNGRWLLAPADEVVATSRRYVDGTAVLETTFTTADGEVVLLDAMPARDGRADVVRRLTCTRGTVRIRHDWVVRTDYGQVRPWVSRESAHGSELVVAVAGPDKLVLRGPHLPRGHDGRHSDEFDLSAGDEVTFSTTWVHSWNDVPEPLDFDRRIAATIADQRAWSDHAPGDVAHADLVQRSLLTLLLMTHDETGGIVAAPTTSLPEHFGGERNWDYRFCWLRDAALTLESLLGAGYPDEALQWRDWLLRAVAGDPADLQIMYAVDGGRQLPEREVPHLPGYADSRPVRIGNGAVSQRQNDVLGEVMIALELAREAGLHETPNSWALQRALVDELAEHWDEPDNGLWEIRGPQRHFTHSRVMVWVAFDRGVRAIERHGLDGPLERWRELRDRVREEVLDKGFDHQRGTFTQHYDTTEVDASLLTIPLVGFLPGDDPRVLGTIGAVRADLSVDGLLLRYRTETGVDGIPGDENPFLACSFWLVSALAAAGRRDEAHALMDRLCALANDVGLLSEEYDVGHRRMAGNFPQAFSHLTLVQAALALR
ncbi:glycoside hydrolase family 15 protein [Nocardioides sp. zg-1228]|uniref:glycoside hydrolase family 15 protein n=1 Tax=Nocardioides sp. zg-1228 TaxID=2763008 RepID=UPI00164305D1|nr:glycoside hydrolase family 15 protein [Nocardioides sp. zg-1228]MBC2934342.1 glycoside hydrolase family 15 protein [Nocardioides sp. zg-1228]QSF59119.1 glycoside hydrolase family 15 protein [Nocardioides sp. zg-1228]